MVWSDRLTIAEMRQRTNTDIVAAAHIHKWEWGKTCDTNGPTPTDTRYSIVGYKDGQNKNVATEDPMGKYVQENIRKTTVTNSKKKKKPVRMEYTHTKSVKARSPGHFRSW